MGYVVEGRIAVIGQRSAETHAVAVLFLIVGRINGDFLLLVTRPPTPLIGSFMQSNAVEPGTKTGVAMKAADAAKDLDEDFLGDVGGIGRIVEAAGDERVERLVILGNQDGECVLGAGL